MRICIPLLLATCLASVSNVWAELGPEVLINQQVTRVKLTQELEPARPCNIAANPDTYMTITATWRNTSVQLIADIRSQTMVPVIGAAYPQRFPNGNILQKPDPKVGGLDQVVGPQEEFKIIYKIKLASCNSFAFWVDLYGRMDLSVREFDVDIQLYRSPAGLSDTDKQMYRDIIYSFAEGVREQSNGAHRIRTVSFHGKEFQQHADVQWVQECRERTPFPAPQAYPAGRGKPGKIIYFCDSWVGSSGAFNGNTKGRGYTLAHEWGHYFYGLLDEYCLNSNDGTRSGCGTGGTEDGPRAGDNPVLSIMNYQYNALGGDRRWLNFSSKAVYAGKETDAKTAQTREFGASGWATLVDPSKLGSKRLLTTAFRSQNGFTALPAVSPDPDSYRLEPDTIDKNTMLCSPVVGFEKPCRPDVHFTGRLYLSMLVIDRSKPDATLAAEALLDELYLGEWQLGIISFDGTPSLVQPIIPLDTELQRENLRTVIKNISAGDGKRAVSQATYSALQYMISAQLLLRNPPTQKITYLITGGGDTTGKKVSDLVSKDYARERAYLAIVDMGAPIDPDIENAALKLNKQLHHVAISGREALDVLNEQMAYKGPVAKLRWVWRVPTPPNPKDTQIAVAKAYRGLVVVTYYRSSQGAMTFKLQPPTGTTEVTPRRCFTAGTETVCVFRVTRTFYPENDPDFVGTWNIRLQTAVSSPEWGYKAFGLDDSQNVYLSSIHSNAEHFVNYPERVVIQAILTQDLPIAKATVNARVTRPDGSVVPLSIHDDGLAPDTTANDGIYAGVMEYTTNGIHLVQADFSNVAATAILTNVGLAGKGEITLIPFGEQFDSLALAEFDIQGVRLDDYGNTTFAAAPLASDWTMRPGRLEAVADLDVFRALAVGSGTYDFVLRDFGGGMTPRLRLLAADGSTVLVNATMSTHGTLDGRLRVTLPLVLDQVVFAEVSDVFGAAGGHYNITSGLTP